MNNQISKVILGVVSVLCVCGVAIYWIYTQYAKEPQIDSRIAHCYLPLGGKKASGIRIAIEDNKAAVSLDSTSDVSQVVSTEILAELDKCVQDTLKITLQLPTDFENIPTQTQLGLILDNWVTAGTASTSHLRVAIDPPRDSELNNLMVGPNVGLRWRVVSDWCRISRFASCISCDANVDNGTTGLRITKRPGAALQKVDLGPIGAAPAGNAPRPPWEFVIGDHRFGFACKKPG